MHEGSDIIKIKAVLKSNTNKTFNDSEKRAKLTAFVKSVLDNTKHQSELNTLMTTLGITRNEVINTYLNYDMDVCAYGNEIFEPLAMRLVLHLHNLLENSWHQERQATMLEYIKLTNPKTAIDMGFGEPTLYVKYLLKNTSVKLTLCDISDSAFKFAAALLKIWNSNWQQSISFKQIDMNHDKFTDRYNLYIFQDSIEHIPEPTLYLHRFTQAILPGTKIILSLPIGPIIPAHKIAWNTSQEAISWIKNSQLKILKQKKVHVNPQIDLFADKLNYEYYDLYLLCEK